MTVTLTEVRTVNILPHHQFQTHSPQECTVTRVEDIPRLISLPFLDTESKALIGGPRRMEWRMSWKDHVTSNSTPRSAGDKTLFHTAQFDA